MIEYMNKVSFRLNQLARRTIRFLGGLESRDAEYDFEYRHVIGEGVSILDVGACKSEMPLLFAKRGNSVTVIDLSHYHEQHPNLTIIQGDFLSNTLPDNSFDYVVMVSSLEHMGKGSYSGPVCKDGDFKAISEAKRIIKPTGRIVITFPFVGDQPDPVRFSGYYNLARVKRLFEGLHILDEEYYLPKINIFGRVVDCTPTTLEQISKVDHAKKKYLYSSIGCYVVSPAPRLNFN
jgi:SAM-dependent methyltransferase